MEPISDSLKDVLVRQGLRRRTVGAESLHRMKERERANGALDPAVAAALGEVQEMRGGVEMLMKRGRVASARPLLIIISGGKA